VSDQLVIVAGLLLAGYVLIALEAFVVPGFGVPGIAGFLCLAGGCWLAFRWFGVLEGTVAVLLVLSSTTAFLMWIPRTHYGRNVIQRKTLADARSPTTTLTAGDVGVAESDLRPSGVGRFGDLRESVVTDGDFVGDGTVIRIVSIEGARVLVERQSATDDHTEDKKGES